MKKLLKTQNVLHYFSFILYWLLIISFSITSIVFSTLEEYYEDMELLFLILRISIIAVILLALFAILFLLGRNADKINMEVTRKSQHSFGMVINKEWTKKYFARNKVVRRRFLLTFSIVFGVTTTTYVTSKILLYSIYLDSVIAGFLQSLSLLSLVFSILSGIMFVTFYALIFKPKLVEVDGQLLLIYSIMGQGKIFCNDKVVLPTSRRSNKKRFTLPDSETKLVYLDGAIYKSVDEVDSFMPTDI